MITRAVRHQRIRVDAPARLETGPWRRSMFPLVAIALAEVAVNRAGTLALTWAGNSADAGAYALAFSLSAVVILPRVAVNTQFAPMVAERFARGDTHGVQALLNHASLWATLAAAGMAGALWLVAEPLLPHMFGPAAVGVLPVLGILLVGQIIASAAGSQIYLLTMSGQEMLAAIVLIGFALADLAASVMLVPRLGPSGAALATSACLVGMNIAMALLVWHRLGVKPGSFGVFGKPWNTGCAAATEMGCIFSTGHGGWTGGSRCALKRRSRRARCDERRFPARRRADPQHRVPAPSWRHPARPRRTLPGGLAGTACRTAFPAAKPAVVAGSLLHGDILGASGNQLGDRHPVWARHRGDLRSQLVHA